MGATNDLKNRSANSVTASSTERESEREREHYNSYYPIKKYKASQFKLSFYEYKKGKEEKKIDKLTYEHIS